VCGFAGILAEQQTLAVNANLLQSMGDSIVHRGPDDQGIYTSADNCLGFVHRRLAILDLSAAGHQPMASTDQRYVIAYNGEIYNHLELRRELEKQFDCQWRGHSDTETLLEGIRCWGIEQTVSRCVGMFAFALWDSAARTLTLGRDRVGEKPLYYGFCNGVFLFGSELKALKAHPAFDSRINIAAVALMLRHKYIPAPHTIYQQLFKLLPGSLLTLQADKLEQGYDIQQYWSFDTAAAKAENDRFSGTEQDALHAIETQLKLAVSEQMLADVPLGAFLSGGTDSSLIAALMQSQAVQPVRTFTVGFNVPEYNEAEHAKAVAAHLGTNHTEIYVGESEALNVVPKLASMYDEPFADSSQIPTYLIAAEARKHVTVALSGDAGDELFGGYTRYAHANNLAHTLNKIPQPCFAILKLLKPLLNAEIWLDLEKMFSLDSSGAISNRLERLAELSAMSDFNGVYQHVISTCKQPDLFLLQDIAITSAKPTDGSHNIHIDKMARMMLMDCSGYLPDDILVKVDRAAMATSLETRVPMLDHRFIELALRLSTNIKVNGGVGKWPLKQILYKYVPRALLERPKTGFGVPLEHWLRGPLKDWAEALLDSNKLKQQAIFNPVRVRKYWREHLSGKQNWQYLLWNLLMFQSWLEQQ
jgi:asparagine synthase (glutamine-hydrolysing)